MRKCRLFFSKTGKTRYISHLDLMRVFRRAFNRAEIAVAHSEGFNPHPIMAGLLPLPTGQESVYDVLDVTFETEVGSFLLLPERINPCLPQGIKIIRAGVPTMKPADIFAVMSQATVKNGEWAVPDDDVTFEKRTKSDNVKTITVKRAQMRLIDPCTLEFLLPPDISPALVAAELGHGDADIMRTGIFDKNGRSFV
jgi:radical SAM-linked protein